MWDRLVNVFNSICIPHINLMSLSLVGPFLAHHRYLVCSERVWGRLVWQIIVSSFQHREDERSQNGGYVLFPGGSGGDGVRVLSREPRSHRIGAPRIQAGRGRSERRAPDNRRFSRSLSVSPPREIDGPNSSALGVRSPGMHMEGPSSMSGRDQSPSLTSPTNVGPMLVPPRLPSRVHSESGPVSGEVAEVGTSAHEPPADVFGASRRGDPLQEGVVRKSRGNSSVVIDPDSPRSRALGLSGSRAKSPGGSTEAMAAGPWRPARGNILISTTRDHKASSSCQTNGAGGGGLINHASMSAHTGLLPGPSLQQVPSSELNRADQAGARGVGSTVRPPSTSSQGLGTGGAAPQWQRRRRQPSNVEVARNSQRTHEQDGSAGGLGRMAGDLKALKPEQSGNPLRQLGAPVGGGLKHEALGLRRDHEALRPSGTGQGNGEHVGNRREEVKREQAERPWKSTRHGRRPGYHSGLEQNPVGSSRMGVLEMRRDEGLGSRTLDRLSGPKSPDSQATSPHMPLSPQQMRSLAEQRLRSMGEDPP